MDKQEQIECYRLDFHESDANERERIIEILRDLSEDDEDYKSLIIELENYEKEEDLDYGEDYPPKEI